MLLQYVGSFSGSISLIFVRFWIAKCVIIGTCFSGLVKRNFSNKERSLLFSVYFPGLFVTSVSFHSIKDMGNGLVRLGELIIVGLLKSVDIFRIWLMS